MGTDAELDQMERHAKVTLAAINAGRASIEGGAAIANGRAQCLDVIKLVGWVRALNAREERRAGIAVGVHQARRAMGARG